MPNPRPNSQTSAASGPLIKTSLRQRVQVNIPFEMLLDTHLDFFLQRRLNPEIRIDAHMLERYRPADVKPVADRLHQNGSRITLHAPFNDLAPGSTDPAIRAVTRRRFRQVLGLVPVFKPRSVVCHAGYDKKYHGFFQDEWIRLSLDMWSWMAQRLNALGTRLMLENVYEKAPGELAALLEPLERYRVGWCFDTGHCAAFGRSELGPWIDRLGVYLGQVHLHDNLGLWDDHLALGHGSIDFEPLIAYLRTCRNNPPIITIENHREADLVESLKHLEHDWPLQ